MREKLKNWLEKPLIQNGVLLVIVINAILLGLMTSENLMAQYGGILSLANDLCLAIFVLELVLRIVAHGGKFFKDGWNLFDFFIVAISLFPTTGIFSSLRIIRIFRVLRTLRVVTKLGRLRLIVQAIIGSLPSIGWTSLLLGIIFYVFAVIGTTLFGPSFPDWFGDVGKSTYTLFQVMTLESWSMGISRPVMEVFPWAFLYFVPFILLTAYVVLNVVVGVVVNTISEIADANKQEELHNRSDCELQEAFLKLKEQMEVVELLLQEKESKK